jgi:1-acyl-sn-glycerol-3-phosphate acyltransferase
MRTIRAAFRLTAFTAATLALYAAWYVGRFVVPNKIYWRQVIFAAWTMSFVRVSNMQIETKGTPPKPPFFLVTNHLGYTDMAALRAVVKGVFVAKAEVEDWFLAGRICRDLGTIFIDRANRRDIPRAGEKIIERLDAGEGVIVFPEGTSTAGETVLTFNSSFLEFAARAEIPVSYAAISYLTPPGEINPSVAVCWGEDIGFFAHLWRLLKLSKYTAIITFGEAPVLNANRKALANELRQRVMEKFVPVS